MQAGHWQGAKWELREKILVTSGDVPQPAAVTTEEKTLEFSVTK